MKLIKGIILMPEILEDFSKEAISEAIEANLYASTPFSHNWPDAEIYTGPEISWCMTNVAFPPCNAIFRANLNPDKVDSTIEGLVEKGRARNVPLHWWIGRDSRPADLAEHLAAFGFTTFGGAAGMAIDLQKMKEDVHNPSDLRISEVVDADTLKTWCHITRLGFGIPEHAEEALLEWFTIDLQLNQPIKFYLGTWRGKPVTTSLLFLAEGVAGIYFVATLPEARRQGFGFAITYKPLEVAREMGYRIGILQASKMGEPVYRRMGFKKYSVIGSYSWLNTPDKKD